MVEGSLMKTRDADESARRRQKNEQTRPLSITFVDHSSEAGGAELALARILERRPTDVVLTVVAPKWEAGTAYRVVKLKGQNRPGATSSGLAGRVRFLIDVVHSGVRLGLRRDFRSTDVVVANTSRAALIVGIATIFGRKGTVIALHLRDEISTEVLGKAGFKAMTWALRRADGIVANSAHTLSTALPHIPRGTQIATIASPLGLEAAPPHQSQPRETLRYGMVARITPWKGQLELLEAFDKALRNLPCELHFAGAPLFGAEAYLETLSARIRELGLRDRVFLHGHVSDVAGFIDSIDIGVQCSIRPEPLGQNVLQYLARRRLAIASSEGGPAEWVAEGVTGLLFKPSKDGDLARALVEAYHRNDLREEIAGRSTMLLPSDTEIVDETYRFYRSLAETQ